MITPTQIANATGSTLMRAANWCASINDAAIWYDINTPARIGGFIGQARVESEDFCVLEENLFYSSADRIAEVFEREVPSLEVAQSLVRNPRALALAVYSNRLGNGGPETGDGWAFRGRGIFMLTGREQYQDATINLGIDYITAPELVATPASAALTAAWYWHTNHCNELADAGLWNSITKAVNGPAMLQASARLQYSQDATQAFA